MSIVIASAGMYVVYIWYDVYSLKCERFVLRDVFGDLIGLYVTGYLIAGEGTGVELRWIGGV